jgi:hypothetical protein
MNLILYSWGYYNDISKSSIFTIQYNYLLSTPFIVYYSVLAFSILLKHLIFGQHCARFYCRFANRSRYLTS